jgi:hypothetical protein
MRSRLTLVAVFLASFLAGVALTPGLHAQDTTTMLSNFLNDLRAGTLGVTQTITSIKSASYTTALTHANPANQTGNATATFKMNGLGAAAAPCTITPTSTGRVLFTITGQVTQSTTADGATFKLAEGTGAAPANAAAASGTVISATQTWTALTGNLIEQFSITACAGGASCVATTALTVGTAVWFDLQVADVTGGTAAITNVDCTAHEL